MYSLFDSNNAWIPPYVSNLPVMLSSSSQIISRTLPLNAIEVYISEIQLSPQGNYSYSTLLAAMLLQMIDLM